MDNNYLDYLSTISNEDLGDSLKDLMQDNFEFFKHYLDELFHVEANYIYLNLVCGVSQTKIGDMIGVSQYGVSKRITSGLNKLTHLLRIPETNRVQVKKDMDLLLPMLEADVLFNYYFMKTYALTGRVMNLDHNLVNTIVTSGTTMLDNLSQATSINEFITTYLKNHKVKITSLAQVQSQYPHIYKNIIYFKDNSQELDLLTIKAQRYYTYLKDLLKISSYGDYTFKMYDKDRL